MTARLAAVARWVGQVTVLADKFPVGGGAQEEQVFIRDSEARRPRVRPRAHASNT